jgi:hypothetical protein
MVGAKPIRDINSLQNMDGLKMFGKNVDGG